MYSARATNIALIIITTSPPRRAPSLSRSLPFPRQPAPYGESQRGAARPPPSLRPSPKRAAPAAYFYEKKLERQIAGRAYAGRGEGNRGDAHAAATGAMRPPYRLGHTRTPRDVAVKPYDSTYCVLCSELCQQSAILASKNRRSAMLAVLILAMQARCRPVGRFPRSALSG